MTLTYRVGVGGAGTVDLGDVVFLGDMPGFTERAGGDATGGGGAGQSGVTIQDAGGTLNLTGLNKFVVEESACTSNVRIFTGISSERGISRGEYTTGAGRAWDVNVLDSNGYLHLRVIRDGNHGNRPAETDAQRVAWLLSEVLNGGHVRNGTGGLFGANGPTAGVLGSPRNLDAADYRNQHADDVLADIGPPGNRRFFTYWDPTLAAVCLFYGLDSENLGNSTLRISNVAADADSVTFAPFQDATMTRDPTDVFGGVNYTYRHGTIYREDPDTISTFLDRSVAVENDRVGLASTASTFVDRLLDKASTERDTVTCTIRIPRAQVNLVIAGQRIQVKFSHLPGLTSFTYRYVLARTVWQDVPNAEFYYVTLELSDKIGGGLAGGGGAPGPFVPGATVGRVQDKLVTSSGIITITNTLDTVPGTGNTLLAVIVQRSTSGTVTKSGWTTHGFVDGFSGGGRTVLLSRVVGSDGLDTTADGGTIVFTVGANEAALHVGEWSGSLTLDGITTQAAAATTNPESTASIAAGSSTVLALGVIAGSSSGADILGPITGTFTTLADGLCAGDIIPAYLIGYDTDAAASYQMTATTGGSLFGETVGTIIATFSGGNVNTPTHGQTVTETATGVAAGATLTTRYGYYPRSLQVTVGGVAVVPTETNPAAGTFTLPIDSTGSVVLITYQAADGTLTSSTNIATPVATAPVVPSTVLPADQWKQPARVATTASGTLATAFENGDTIDGVVLATGDRILLKDQSTGSQNGIYVVAASGAPTRATDFDASGEVVGALVYVVTGTVNAGRIFRNTNTTAPTIGTTALTFAEFVSAGALDSLSDVVITGATVAQRLRFDGTNWVNTSVIWQPLTNGDTTTPELIFAAGDVVMVEA